MKYKILILLSMAFLLMLSPLAKAQTTLDREIAEALQEFSQGKKIPADDFIQYAPAASVIVLDLLGAPCSGNLGRHAGEVILGAACVAVIVNPIKYFYDELRPDGSSYNSFPSGHTATAFMGAELVRMEYGNAWGAAAYSVAVTTGFLRMYNNRHYLCDVIGGAAAGIASAQLSYRLSPLLEQVFPFLRELDIHAWPSVSNSADAVCINLTLNF